MKICLLTKYQALRLLEIQKCIRFGSFSQGIYSVEATLQALWNVSSFPFSLTSANDLTASKTGTYLIPDLDMLT